MSREIKFRAWDGKKIYFTEHGDIGRTGETEFEWSPYCFVIDWPQGDGCPEVGKWKVMQYTGLKDKNGKEIYEADIVRNKMERICEVMFQITLQFSGWDLRCINPGNFNLPYYHGWDQWEVMGNIYETPELLKK